jgi:hypothetical protein
LRTGQHRCTAKHRQAAQEMRCLHIQCVLLPLRPLPPAITYKTAFRATHKVKITGLKLANKLTIGR